MVGSKKSRNWLFTCNKFTDEDFLHIARLAGDMSVRYLVYGKETAPTTGHKHLQGFVIFRNNRNFTGVQKFFSVLTHCNLRVGDDKATAMMEYCKKEGEFIEFGNPPLTPQESGKKGGTNTKRMYSFMIREAKLGNLHKIEKKYPGQYLRYRKTLLDILKDDGVMPPDEENVTGVWIYGAAGAGKSHYARETFPGYYDKPCNKWWDNYKGEEHILIDDFDDGHKVLAHHLKRWSDKYAFSAEIKGSQINLRPKFIVVTSQYRIEEIWNDTATKDALNRRFRKIKIHIDSQGNRVVTDQGF